MKRCSAILAVVLALLGPGCGGDDTAATGKSDPVGATGPSGATGPTGATPHPFPVISDASDPHFATVTYGKGRRAAPKIDPSDQPPPEGLLVRDLVVGSGPVTRHNDRVAVRYTGVDYKSGKVLYSNWKYPPQLEFRLGIGGYGEGWEEGIRGMRPGGRREFVIPSRLAFAQGPLDYVVELVRLEVNPKRLAREADESPFATISGGERKGTEPTIHPPDREPPKRLMSREVEVGSGPVARLGDRVAIRYLGVIYETGEVYYQGWQFPPFLRVGISTAGADWEQGILGMRVGGRRELIIPAHLAPETGAVDYLIELVRIEPDSESSRG